MGLAMIIYFAILFVALMTTLKGVSEDAKVISIVIGVAIGLYCLKKVIWG